MYVLPDCEICARTDDYIVMKKSFGDNGKGHILHKFPSHSEPEEKRRAFERVFEILYNAAERDN